MKLRLIQPPCESDVKWAPEVTLPPLGLAYLASVLRGDHDVEILNAIAFNYSLADIRRILEVCLRRAYLASARAPKLSGTSSSAGSSKSSGRR